MEMSGKSTALNRLVSHRADMLRFVYSITSRCAANSSRVANMVFAYFLRDGDSASEISFTNITRNTISLYGEIGASNQARLRFAMCMASLRSRSNLR